VIKKIRIILVVDVEKQALVLEGPVQRFSQQVVMNKCFLLNLEKILAQIRAVVFEENEKGA